MKTKILASLLTIVSVLVIVAMSWMPMTSAEGEAEGTKTIDEDYYWAYKISFFSDDYFTLSYTIDVQNDVYIDVILLNEENFNLYKNHESFTYYTEGTDFNTIYTNVPSITLTTHDNYYIVVDNTDYPSNGAMPPWDGVNNYCTLYYHITFHDPPPDTGGGSTITWEDDDGDSTLLAILCVSIMGIGIIVAIVVGFLLYDKQKKQKAQQPQQPYQPPYQQPQQPPYNQDQQPPPPGYQPPQQPPQQPY